MMMITDNCGPDDYGDDDDDLPVQEDARVGSKSVTQ